MHSRLHFFFFSTIHQNKPTKIYRLFSLDILSTINHISFTRLVAFSLSLSLTYYLTNTLQLTLISIVAPPGICHLSPPDTHTASLVNVLFSPALSLQLTVRAR